MKTSSPELTTAERIDIQAHFHGLADDLCVEDVTEVIPSGLMDRIASLKAEWIAQAQAGVSLAEAADIDAELRELQSFVLVETGHFPTVDAVARLRARIAKTLGHSDPYCVSHCEPGFKHSQCGCNCGQHRKEKA